MKRIFTLNYLRLSQLWYVPLLVLAMGLMFVRILVMAHFFDSQSFGYFNAGLLVSNTLCMSSSFGFYLLLQREMPKLFVRNQQQCGLILLVQCIILAFICALICMIIVLAGVKLAGLSVNLSLVSLLHGLSQQLFLIVTVESRSRSQSVRFAQQNFLRGITLFIIGIFTCYKTDSPFWVLLAEAITTLVIVQGTLYSIFKKTSDKVFAIYRIAIKQLPQMRWKSATVLFTVSLINYALMNLDRWLAAQTQSVDNFAMYAFMGLILLIGQSVQAVVNASAYPLLARRYASANSKDTYLLCFQISCFLTIGCTVFGLPTWWLLNEGVQRWFQNYQAGLALIPVFIAVATLRISDFWTSFLIITGLENRLLLINIIAVVSSSTFWLYLFKPWRSSDITIMEIGLLAVMLTLVNYILVAIVAWQSIQRIK